jgi:hypothetical protein
MVQLSSATAVREALAEHHVYNQYIQVPKGSFILSYTARDNGRGGRMARWSARRQGFNNNPRGEYYEHGVKTFWINSGREAREAGRIEAIDWMTGRYVDAVDFVKDPWGSYQPRAQLVAFLAKFDIVWTALNTRKKA